MAAAATAAPAGLAAADAGPALAANANRDRVIALLQDRRRYDIQMHDLCTSQHNAAQRTCRGPNVPSLFPTLPWAQRPIPLSGPALGPTSHPSSRPCLGPCPKPWACPVECRLTLGAAGGGNGRGGLGRLPIAIARPCRSSTRSNRSAPAWITHSTRAARMALATSRPRLSASCARANWCSGMTESLRRCAQWPVADCVRVPALVRLPAQRPRPRPLPTASSPSPPYALVRLPALRPRPRPLPTPSSPSPPYALVPVPALRPRPSPFSTA